MLRRWRLAHGAAQPIRACAKLRTTRRAVVTVPVKRGVVTHVVLDADETITEVGAGLGGDCSKADAAWCVAAQPGGRHLFVKPKSGANAPNNLAVVTDRRAHSFRFVVLPDDDARPPVYRLVVKATRRGQACGAAGGGVVALPELPALVPPASARRSWWPSALTASAAGAELRLLDRRRRGVAGHRADADLRRRTLHLPALPWQPRGARGVPRAAATAARPWSTRAWKTTCWWSIASAAA